MYGAKRFIGKNGDRYEIGLAGSESDLQKVVETLNERGGDLLRSGPLKPLKGFQVRALLDPERTIVIFIRNRKKRMIVATMMVCFRYTWRKQIGTIEYVHTDEDYRRQGLADKMFDRMFAETHLTLVDRIELTSGVDREAARAFYLKRGFKLVEGSNRHFRIDL